MGPLSLPGHVCEIFIELAVQDILTVFNFFLNVTICLPVHCEQLVSASWYKRNMLLETSLTLDQNEPYIYVTGDCLRDHIN